MPDTTPPADAPAPEDAPSPPDAAGALSPQEVARRCAWVMWRNDRAGADAGLVVEHVGPGTATLSLTVEERHLNGHAICHGGITFLLADTAFAYACNSFNDSAVAQHNSITYLRPGRLGETLTATARLVDQSGRSGIYDVAVTGEDGSAVARFRGLSRVIRGRHFDPADPPEAPAFPFRSTPKTRTKP